MFAALLGVLPNRAQTQVAADHSRRSRFRIDGDNGPDVICDTRKIATLPPRPVAAREKVTRAPITVTIEELEDVARTLDEEDARDPTRIPRNFLTRLRSPKGRAVFSVLSPQGDLDFPAGRSARTPRPSCHTARPFHRIRFGSRRRPDTVFRPDCPVGRSVSGRET
jgi:hypothetical protein